MGPYLELLDRHLGPAGEGGMARYRYAIRICPEPVHWGGLSGCTYSEGVSWGKFVSPEQGGRFAEVMADATIAWPIVLKAALQRLEKLGGPVPKPSFEGSDLWTPKLMAVK